MYKAYTSSQLKLLGNIQDFEIFQPVLINNNNKILLVYIMDTFHLYY